MRNIADKMSTENQNTCMLPPVTFFFPPPKIVASMRCGKIFYSRTGQSG